MEGEPEKKKAKLVEIKYVYIADRLHFCRQEDGKMEKLVKSECDLILVYYPSCEKKILLIP